MTDDRIGRRMKKCVNIARAGCRYFGRWPGGAAAKPLPRRRGPPQPPPSPAPAVPDHLQEPVDDDPVAGVQAAGDDDVLVADVVAHDHRPQRRPALSA